MSHGIVEFLNALVGRRPREAAPDKVAFDEARKRLVATSRALAREADAFGDMVHGMRGAPRKRKAKTK